MKKKRICAALLAVILAGSLLSGTQVSTASAADIRDQFVSYAAGTKGQNGAYFGFGDKNWCVYFIRYCAEHNGTDIRTLFPNTGSVTQSAKEFAEKGRYYYFDNAYIPQSSDARKYGTGINMDTSKIEKGDLAFFISDSGGGFEHIGIVESVNSDGITMIHGSWSNRVVRSDVTFGKTIGTNYPVRFCGIAKPDYDSIAENKKGSGELSIAPTTEPGEHMTPGAPFYFRGSITSDSPITVAVVEIRSGSGESILQSREVTPNKKEVDILNDGLDSLKFGKLGEGYYILRLSAADASGAQAEWSRVFSVGRAEIPDSTLKITPTTKPTQQALGSPFYFRGSITSNYIITSAVVQILGGNDREVVQERVTAPNKTTVDILKDGLDSLKFGALQEGTYILRLTAKDISEEYAEWSAPFMVGAPNSTPAPIPTPAPTPTPVPEQSGQPELTQIFRPEREWWADQFHDLVPNAWYCENIKNAYRYELMNGVGSGYFDPEGTLTVAEAIALAARIHAKYYEKTIPEYDSGSWYKGVVEYAQQNDIPTGRDYERAATREDFVHILAAALPQEHFEPVNDAISFADARPFFYPDEITLLCRAGIIDGMTENGQRYFKPADTITRAQAATLVTRMVIPSQRIGL